MEPTIIAGSVGWDCWSRNQDRYTSLIGLSIKKWSFEGSCLPSLTFPPSSPSFAFDYLYFLLFIYGQKTQCGQNELSNGPKLCLDRSLSNLSQGKFPSMSENEGYNSYYSTIGSRSSLGSNFIFRNTVYVTNKSVRNRRVKSCIHLE